MWIGERKVLKSRPVIGIPTAQAQPTQAGYVYQKVGAPYIHALEAAGAIPILLPVCQDDAAIERLLSLVDGILLQGGGDILPSLYGQEQRPEVDQPSEETDRFELEICRRCIEMDKPLLAICRGIQVLNVALGGTLVQDIPTQLSTPILHRQKQSRQTASHTIHVEPGTHLAEVLGETDLAVNSFHHQALDRLGANLKVSARSEDNLIEGVELPGKDFIVGVQFHPEETTQTVLPTANLFTALVEAGRK